MSFGLSFVIFYIIVFVVGITSIIVSMIVDTDDTISKQPHHDYEGIILDDDSLT